MQDSSYNLTNPRRRSNSSSHHGVPRDFTTKFEQREPEPVFEEELHGPEAEAEDEIESHGIIGHALEKGSTTDSVSVSGQSVEGEEHVKKV